MTYKAPAPRYIGPANMNGGPGNKPIDRIVIHCTVSSCCDSAESIAGYFKQTTKYASAHYVVDAKHTIQSLYDSYIGYHAPPNQHAIGIEMCCTLANQGKGHWRREDHKAMLARTARLTAELCLAYDLPARKVGAAGLRAGKRGITGHVDVSAAFKQSSHWDPGPYFPWRYFIRLVKREIAAIKAEQKAKAKPVKTAKPKPPAKPKRKNTNVRKAVDLFDQALDLLAEVPATRKHVKAVAQEIQDDVHRLPEQ